MQSFSAPTRQQLHQISAHNPTVAELAADRKNTKTNYLYDLNRIIKLGTTYAN
ncbi:hypothetical protein ACIDE9_04955 [Methylophilus sp. 'Pure River']|uniref:hypothetical protein n=1 Tax=Methylophilus sp. 'Pure River' TaxID=3377117 RepID=UPI00398E5CBB